MSPNKPTEQIKNPLENDVFGEILKNNPSFLQSQNQSYLKYKQNFEQTKSQNSHNLIEIFFEQLRKSYLQPVFFIFQNSFALGLILIYSLSFLAGSLTIQSFAKAGNNGLSPDSDNHVASLDKCDISLRYPKNIENIPTYLRAEDASNDIYLKPKVAGLFAGTITNPGGERVDWRVDYNIACFSENIDLSKAKTVYGGDYDLNYVIPNPVPAFNPQVISKNLNKEDLATLTNWKIAESDIKNITLYEKIQEPRRSGESDQAATDSKNQFNSKAVSFDFGGKKYFVWAYKESFKPLSQKPGDSFMSQIDMQFNSAAKSETDKTINFEGGNYIEYVGFKDESKDLISKINSTAVLISLTVIIVLVLSSVFFFKLRKIPNTND